MVRSASSNKNCVPRCKLTSVNWIIKGFCLLPQIEGRIECGTILERPNKKRNSKACSYWVLQWMIVQCEGKMARICIKNVFTQLRVEKVLFSE
ncbi:hypothetical protein THO17_27750 [Marinomonas sp. THO17]